MNYGSSTSRWKPWRWMRLDLTFPMRDIYIISNLNPLTKFTSSRRSTEFKDILPWNISQMITKIIPISTRIVISYVRKRGILLLIWWEVNWNWDEYQCQKKEIHPKEQNYENQSGIWVGTLTIWVKSFEIEFSKSISSIRICWHILLMDNEFSKDKHISRWVDWENLIYDR